jgi:O-antigen ligase
MAALTPSFVAAAFSRADTARRAALAAALVAAPWPWGSVASPWIAVWCAVLGALCAVAPLPARGPAAPWAGLLLGLAFAGLAAAQLLPVSPHKVWALLAAAGGPTAVGVSRDLPTLAIGAPLLAMVGFVAGGLYGRDRAGANVVLTAIAFSGAAYALYGLYQDGAWRLVTGLGQASLHTPFVNRNHAATYYGSCAAVAFALLLVRLHRALDSGAAVEHALRELSPKAALAATCFVICLAATFLTQSRAGVMCTLVALFAQTAVWLSRRASGPARLGLSLGLALLGALLVAELAGGRVALRLGAEGLVDPMRAEAFRATLAIIRDNPWVGTGLGTFIDVFPAYRGPALNTLEVWDHAHNSWLELAAEMGLPFAAAVAAYGAWLLLALVRRMLSRRAAFEAAPAAALGVLLLGGLHAMVDFSLQIPAVLMLFMAVAGLGWARTRHAGPSGRGAPVLREVHSLRTDAAPDFGAFDKV